MDISDIIYVANICKLFHSVRVYSKLTSLLEAFCILIVIFWNVLGLSWGTMTNRWGLLCVLSLAVDGWEFSSDVGACQLCTALHCTTVLCWRDCRGRGAHQEMILTRYNTMHFNVICCYMDDHSYDDLDHQRSGLHRTGERY